VADVEGTDFDPPRACHLDRKVSRAGRDLQDPSAGRQAAGQLCRLLPVGLDLALGPARAYQRATGPSISGP
jgi:hypothetical protein